MLDLPTVDRAPIWLEAGQAESAPQPVRTNPADLAAEILAEYAHAQVVRCPVSALRSGDQVWPQPFYEAGGAWFRMLVSGREGLIPVMWDYRIVAALEHGVDENGRPFCRRTTDIWRDAPVPPAPPGAVRFSATCAGRFHRYDVDKLPQAVSVFKGGRWCYMSFDMERGGWRRIDIEAFEAGDDGWLGPPRELSDESMLSRLERMGPLLTDMYADREAWWMDAVEDDRHTPESRSELEEWAREAFAEHDERMLEHYEALEGERERQRITDDWNDYFYGND